MMMRRMGTHATALLTLVTLALALVGVPLASPASALTAPVDAGAYAPLSPVRILDTRSGNGASGPVPANGTIVVQVTGRGGVPASGVGAVVLNVTVTEPSSFGFVTAWPTGGTLPTASNLNYSAGQTVPNLVTVKVGPGGSVNLTNSSSGTVQLIADVAGYYVAGAATQPGMFQPTGPVRLLDTRGGLGASGPVPANEAVSLQVAGRGGIPAAGVGAVVFNLTVTEPSSFGFVTAWPSGGTLPTASNLNYAVAQTVPNLVTAKVGADGRVNLTNSSSGTAHLIADVAGYYLAGTGTLQGAFVPLSPTRVLDTRAGLRGTTLAPTGVIGLPIAGNAGVPATGAGAVVLNLTVTQPTNAGFITAWPSGGTRPTASNVNYGPQQTIPNLAIVALGTGGRVALGNNSAGSAELIADVAGYFVDIPPPPPVLRVVRQCYVAPDGFNAMWEVWAPQGVNFTTTLTYTITNGTAVYNRTKTLSVDTGHGGTIPYTLAAPVGYTMVSCSATVTQV